jgi:hypothetical protein
MKNGLAIDKKLGLITGVSIDEWFPCMVAAFEQVHLDSSKILLSVGKMDVVIQ